MDSFHFRNTSSQVAGSQRDASLTNCCMTGCREMIRLVLLANLKSLRLLEDEWVILLCVPGAGDRASPTPLSVTPEPVTPPAEGGGGLLGNSVSSSAERAPASPAGHQGGETTPERPREDVAIGPQSGAGPGWGQPEQKRTRVDTIDHQAGDFRELLDGNSINANQTLLPREVSQRICLCGYKSIPTFKSGFVWVERDAGIQRS